MHVRFALIDRLNIPMIDYRVVHKLFIDLNREKSFDSSVSYDELDLREFPHVAKYYKDSVDLLILVPPPNYQISGELIGSYRANGINFIIGKTGEESLNLQTQNPKIGIRQYPIRSLKIEEILEIINSNELSPERYEELSNRTCEM